MVTRLPWRSSKDGSLVHLYHRVQHHVDITGMEEEDETSPPRGPCANMESHVSLLKNKNQKNKLCTTAPVLNRLSFSFRFLDPAFLSSVSTSLKTTKACWPTETRANPSAGLIFGSA